MKFNKGLLLALMIFGSIASSISFADDTSLMQVEGTNISFLQNILNVNSQGSARLGVQVYPAEQLKTLSSDITGLFVKTLSIQEKDLKTHLDAVLSVRLNERLELLRAKNTAAAPGSDFFEDVTRTQEMVIKIVELKKIVSERSDLSKYEIEDLRLFNQAIEMSALTLLEVLERSIDARLVKSPNLKNSAAQIRKNLVEIGLGYRPALSQSEQWINEYLGRDRNASVNISARSAIKNILKKTTRDMDIVRSVQKTCSQIFTL